MRHSHFGCWMLLVGAAGAVGCDEKSEDDTARIEPTDPNPLTGTDTGTSDTGRDSAEPEPDDALVIELTVGSISPGNTDLAEFPGLAGVPNVDDDDENGQADWEQAGSAVGDNDYALATVLTHGRDIQLSLSGTGLRIYHGEALILGDGAGAEAVLSGIDEAGLRVEFEDFLDQGILAVNDPERGETIALALTASPLFFNHHLQSSEEVMAMRVAEFGYNNTPMMDGYRDALGDAFFTLRSGRYDYDVWVQDEFEFAYATAPDAHLDIIFDTHRDGQGWPGEGLDDFPEDQYEGPDWLITNWGPRNATSLDYGGNFEVSPPVTVDGVDYPYGRVYYGGYGSYTPMRATQNAVEGMQVQEPFMPDSTWLCVGHIDEFTTTIPDSSAPKGFRLVFADTHSAWELLDGLDPSMAIPRYSGGMWEGHNMDTISDMVSDAALRALNDEVQEILDEQKEVFVRELGLSEEDIIYMPSLFEEVAGCGSAVAALIPGMANLIVADVEGTPTAFIPDPFLRSDVNDQDSDPMIARVRELFPDSIGTVFLDDWSVYHMGLGEVHCGTNVKRRAANAWWEDSGHLISQEVTR